MRSRGSNSLPSALQLPSPNFENSPARGAQAALSRCQRGQAGISRHVLFIGGRRLVRRSARQAAERKVKNRITANVNNKMEAHEDIFA